MAETGDRNGVRERVLGAAIEIAQTAGLESMSQAKVARRAGVRQSHLTYYFPTRVDLIKAMFSTVRDQIMEESRAAVEVVCKPGLSPAAQLREFLKAELDKPERARMLMSLFLAAQEDARLADWLKDFEREMVEPAMVLFASAGLQLDRKYAELIHLFLCGCATLRVFLNNDQTTRTIADGVDALIETLSQLHGAVAVPETV